VRPMSDRPVSAPRTWQPCGWDSPLHLARSRVLVPSSSSTSPTLYHAAIDPASICASHSHPSHHHNAHIASDKGIAAMGLGILDDHKLEHVPGTANVFEGKRPGGETVAEKGAGIVNGDGSANGRMGGWKYDRTGKILLVPQPSEDPNDPLNWPLWHRDLILFVLSFASILASTLSPLLAADTASLAILFTRTFTEMALLTGYHLLAVGLAGFLFVPSARIWGKRHLYVLGTLIVVISSFWGGGSGTNYKSLLWARVFQGIGLAPFEALVNASVGDMYFVHERGARMAVSNLALFGGAFFTPVLVGKIAATMGWEWTFWFVGIFMAVGLVGVVFWCPETTYKRDSRFEIDTMGNFVETRAVGRVEGSVGSSAEAERGLRAEKPVGDETVHENGTVLPAKATWKQSLALFNGRKSEERYLHLLLRPFSLFLHPGILWVGQPRSPCLRRLSSQYRSVHVCEPFTDFAHTGMSYPRHSHRLDRSHRHRPLRANPRPTPLVHRSRKRVHVHRRLYWRTAWLRAVRPSLGLVREENDGLE
jgi:MFS family permease